MVDQSNAIYLRAKAVWPRAIVIMRTQEGFRAFGKDRKPWSDATKDYPGTDKARAYKAVPSYKKGFGLIHDADDYMRWIDHEVKESQAVRKGGRG